MYFIFTPMHTDDEAMESMLHDVEETLRQEEERMTAGLPGGPGSCSSMEELEELKDLLRLSRSARDYASQAKDTYLFVRVSHLLTPGSQLLLSAQLLCSVIS